MEKCRNGHTICNVYCKTLGFNKKTMVCSKRECPVCVLSKNHEYFDKTTKRERPFTLNVVDVINNFSSTPKIKKDVQV